MQASLLKRSIVEFFGTFFLVSIATGAIIHGQVPLIGIAIAPALAVLVMIPTIGSITGAHYNPAVSFSFFLLKKMNAKEFISYVSAQLSGSALAALALCAVYTKSAASAVQHGVNSLSPSTSYLSGFIIEMVITLIFVLLLLMATQVSSNIPTQWAPVSISITIFALLLAFIPATGACFNPARWFGPALIGGNWINATLYIFAPLLGGALAVPAFRYLSAGEGGKPA